MTDEQYIQLAIDYLGMAIRDNSKKEKVKIGKAINNGTWNEEE